MGYFKEAIKGTGWMGALRLVTRGLGFIKILILARILSPQDFGIFAIAAISLALLETFTEPGVSLALVQQKEKVDKYIGTAWIISILRGVLISLLLFISAPFISQFFGQPQSLKILQTAALIPLARGFINPAAVNFVKKLEFHKEFILRSIPAIADIGTAIFLAIHLKSPISIVFGMLVGATAEVILTFLMTPLHPRLEFVKSHAGKLIGYGKWVTVGWIMNYLSEQFDDILVGKMLGTNSLGIYQMAFKLSVLPSTELSEVISKVVFPVYSKIAHDKQRLRKAVIKTTAVLTAIALPLTLILIFFSRPIVLILLGNRWIEVVPSLQILAIYGFIRSYGQGASAVLFASGNPDIAAKLRAVRFSIMAILLFPLISRYNIQGAAMAVVASALILQPLLWISLKGILKKNER